MKKSIYETIIIIIGNFILALGICAFITPAGLITGGASGIGIAIKSLTGINISYTVYVINIIMFIIGYIYLDSVPKTTTVKKTTVTTTTTSTTKVKSNNNYLSSLSIDIGILNFDKNVFEYTLDVENDIDSIKIEALPEDNSSVVTGIGEFPLVVGINEFKISVTSESNETREYVIHINKKENEEIKIVKKKNDKHYILVVILVSVLLITILIFLLKLMINRKKVK